MCCSRAWCEAARAHYARRMRKVLPTPDALLHAAEAASPGDTLVVAGGLHELSTEISIDKPLRLLAGPGGSAVLASSHHVLLRARCSAQVEGLTLVRLGDAVGQPFP